jgi:hypothetical protein
MYLRRLLARAECMPLSTMQSHTRINKVLLIRGLYSVAFGISVSHKNGDSKMPFYLARMNMVLLQKGKINFAFAFLDQDAINDKNWQDNRNQRAR